MRSSIILIVISISLIMFSSCIFSKKNTKNDGDCNISELIIDKTFMPTGDEPNYVINSASITDSILTISINYKGKTEKDQFKLIFNGMYAKSLPAIATLVIVPTEQGDADFKQELKYNISNAKYNNGEKTIIKVFGWDEKLSLVH